MRRRMAALFALLAATVLAGVGGAAAQVVMTDETNLTREMIQKNAEQIVAENLGLTEEQGKLFWPLYRSYVNERAGLGDRIASLLVRYRAAYQVMDDETALELTDELIDIQKNDVALRKKYMGKMRKVLPGALVARFFQIDNKLDAYLKAVAADEIPLMSGGKPITIVPAE